MTRVPVRGRIAPAMHRVLQVFVSSSRLREDCAHSGGADVDMEYGFINMRISE